MGSEIYRGHRIEISEPESTTSKSTASKSAAGMTGAEALSSSSMFSAGALKIDGKQKKYGRLPEGKFYLRDYAYDWQDDLGDLARRYVDYLEDGKAK